MAIFQFRGLKAWLKNYNLNNFIQEFGAVIIGIFVGLYANEKQREFLGLFGLEGGEEFTFTWPDSWTDSDNEVFFIAGITIFLLTLVLKILVYCNLFDFNKWTGRREKKAKGFNFNGLVQEIATLVVATTFGVFSSPLTSRMLLLYEKSEYPNPVPAAIAIGIGLLVKMLIYSQTLNLNYPRKRIWNGQALPNFFRKIDWNPPAQNFLSILIGIGIGFYAYQSNLVFLPEQQLGEWWPAVVNVGNEAANRGMEESETGRQILRVFRVFSGGSDKRNVKLVPDSFSEEEKRPYWIAGIIIVVLSVLFKILMYLGIASANSLRNFLFGKGKGRREVLGKDYNSIIDECIMIALSTVMGVMTEPLWNNIIKGEETPYPYGGLGILCLALLFFIKLLFVLGILDFNSGRRGKGRKKTKGKRRR